jgi:hypothetical protein
MCSKTNEKTPDKVLFLLNNRLKLSKENTGTLQYKSQKAASSKDETAF